MVAVLLVDVGFGDLHSTKDPAMDLYIIQMSKLILQSAIKKSTIFKKENCAPKYSVSAEKINPAPYLFCLMQLYVHIRILKPD